MTTTTELALTSESGERVRPHFDANNAAARKKLGAPDAWRWYSIEALDGYTLMEGGIPREGVKGRDRWRGVDGQRVIVTAAEVEAACVEYEATTGNCRECAGCGETFAEWSRDTGTTYRPCRRCNATGRAATPSPTPEAPADAR